MPVYVMLFHRSIISVLQTSYIVRSPAGTLKTLTMKTSTMGECNIAQLHAVAAAAAA